MVRFILYMSMAFVTAFVGVSWAARGFPVQFYSPVSIAPLRPMMTETFGGQTARDHERKEWEAQHTAQSDKNPKLDKIRLETLQAANAYAMSPCDKTMKANLIEASTAYTRAWQEKLNCFGPPNMRFGCPYKNYKDAADTFTTPLDARVKEALHAAFDQRGIVDADFPAGVRFDVRMFSGPGLWFEESPLCLPRLRASAGNDDQ